MLSRWRSSCHVLAVPHPEMMIHFLLPILFEGSKLCSLCNITGQRRHGAMGHELDEERSPRIRRGAKPTEEGFMGEAKSAREARSTGFATSLRKRRAKLTGANSTYASHAIERQQWRRISMISLAKRQSASEESPRRSEPTWRTFHGEKHPRGKTPHGEAHCQMCDCDIRFSKAHGRVMEDTLRVCACEFTF